MYQETYPELLEPCDIIWQKKYFEFKQILQIFKIQIVKPILKPAIY